MFFNLPLKLPRNDSAPVDLTIDGYTPKVSTTRHASVVEEHEHVFAGRHHGAFNRPLTHADDPHTEGVTTRAELDVLIGTVPIVAADQRYKIQISSALAGSDAPAILPPIATVICTAELALLAEQPEPIRCNTFQTDRLALEDRRRVEQHGSYRQAHDEEASSAIKQVAHMGELGPIAIENGDGNQREKAIERVKLRCFAPKLL